jgi:hypothetical protein
MAVKTGYRIGDKVQAHDGRIGTVIDVEEITYPGLAGVARSLDAQELIVRFPDLSTIKGTSDHFKPVLEKPLRKVASLLS